MTWIATLIGGALVAVFAFFAVLQWLSDRIYRPSRDDIRQILQASREGRLDVKALDEFSCVRIAYDPGSTGFGVDTTRFWMIHLI